MGLQCVSETCDYPMDSAWAFCPACGVDNRMPRDRKKVPPHSHRFLQRDLGYCTMCGEPAGEPYSFGYKGRILFSLLGVLGGLIVLVALAAIQFGRRAPATPIGRWVVSWYDHPVLHRNRRYGYGTYTTALGNDVSIYLGAAGVLLIVLGALIFVKHQFSRPVWADDASDAVWWSRRWF